MTELDLFAAAIATPDAAARAALLDRECAGNPALRARLDKLLAAHFTAHPLLGPTADGTVTHSPGNATGTPDAATVERPGKVEHVGAILGGKYKLIEEIGEGGMGSVFMAQQTEPVKRAVAVKVIKAGMDSKAVLARFEAERQALALMDHPNIARVLDAGTTESGRPYFVMELVKGVPITQYCDERKLTPRQRLELFVPVCNAIQHAHQKGVIHRDIKPNNVLVAMYDDRPVPKVIDFGVAKAAGQTLTDKTLMTGFGAVVGTPEYMSPEQANLNNLDIDTRSDVYSLGVLLYELLTGSTPVDRKSLGQAALLEVLRIVREVEAPRPSAKLSTIDTLPSVAANRGTEPAKLSKLMKGELDWVLLKALEKDRARRYETANGFAADVQRYLSGEQVQAVPPSVGYRVRKFVRKHRGPVLAAAVVAAALVVSALVSVAFGVKATDAEGKAKADRDAAVKAEGEATDERNRANTEAAKATAAKEQQQAEQYLADMQLMPSVFEKGNGTDVHALLARHLPKPDSPDRRNFEWHYWNRQLNSETRSLQLAGATFPSTAQWTASEDGTRVACFALPDRGVPNAPPMPTLTVWELPSGRRLLSHAFPYEPGKLPPGVTVRFSTLPPKFSPDGKRIAVGYRPFRIGPVAWQSEREECPLVAFEIATGNVLLKTTYSGIASSVWWGFSRDGTRLEVAETQSRGSMSRDSVTRVYDLNTAKVVTYQTRSEPDASASDVLWRRVHPDGKSVVVGRSLPAGAVLPLDPLAGVTASAEVTGLIEIRDLETDTVKRWWPVRTGEPISIVLSGNGERLAAVFRTAPAVRTGELPQAIARLASPRVKIWETATGKELGEWVAPESSRGPLNSGSSLEVANSVLTFSPDGSRLVVELWLGRDPRAGSIRRVVLSGNTAAPFSELTGFPPGVLNSRTINRDGNRFVLSWDDTLCVWNTTSGELLRTARASGAAFRASAITDRGQSFWAVDSAGMVREWSLRPPDPVTVQYPPSGGLTLSPDGTRVGLRVATDVEGGRGSRGFRWEIADTAGKLLHTLSPPKESAAWWGPVTALTAFSRRAERVCMICRPRQTVGSNTAPGGPDATTPDTRGGPELTVWDSATGKVVLHLPLEGVAADTLFSSRLLSRREGYELAFAPDGKTVALANWLKAKKDENGVRLFDVDTGRERPPLGVPAGARVAGITFDPAGDRIAAVVVTLDEAQRLVTATLLIWDAASGKQLVAEPLTGGLELSWDLGQMMTARLVWSPKSDRLAITVTFTAFVRLSDDLFTLRDARTGKVVSTPEMPMSNRVGFRANVPSDMAFNPDGSRLAILMNTVGAAGGTEIRLLDPESGKSLLTLPTPESVSLSRQENSRQMMFSPDGQRLLLTHHAPRTGPSPAESGTYIFSLFTYDASPPPEAKK